MTKTKGNGILSSYSHGFVIKLSYSLTRAARLQEKQWQTQRKEDQRKKMRISYAKRGMNEALQRGCFQKNEEG
jgi:hypothetical protein